MGEGSPRTMRTQYLSAFPDSTSCAPKAGMRVIFSRSKWGGKQESLVKAFPGIYTIKAVRFGHIALEGVDWSHIVGVRYLMPSRFLRVLECEEKERRAK